MEEQKLKHDEKGKYEMADKPKVLGIVALGLIRGIFGTIFAIVQINAINEVIDNPLYEVQSWALPASYFVLGLSIFAFISAVLIWRYKRWGLYFGVASFGGDFIIGIILSLATGTFGGALGFVIDAIILRSIYKYLTSHPETTFFT